MFRRTHKPPVLTAAELRDIAANLPDDQADTDSETHLTDWWKTEIPTKPTRR